MSARVIAYAPARRHVSLNPLTLILDLMARHHSRAALARLDAHLLADIGLTADAAATEARRPFWN